MIDPPPSDAGMAEEQQATPAPEALRWLVVDEFLRGLLEARALRTGFELGLIDRLAEQRSGSAEALGRMIGVDAPGLRLLLELLAANGVLEQRGGDVRLSARFRDALQFRDLLEAKLDFVGFTLGDFADMFTALVRGGGAFTEQSRLFQLFDYRRALEPSPENFRRTRAWVRLTSLLTRYEAAGCMLRHDFGRYRHMLDVGGNSGEFALQLCRANGGLRATVLDLPLVCDVGMEWLLAEPELPRIRFRKADLRREQLPGGHDLITFKSMLHDWPAQDAREFIDKAARALAPGGTLLIYERGPLALQGVTPPLSLVPTLLFFRSYRAPDGYLEQLQALSFEQVDCREVMLDSPFFVVSARKPRG